MSTLLGRVDTFVVINRTLLSEYDRKVLTMLYQPIVGSTTITLYLTLWSLLDKLEVISSDLTHDSLMTNLQISLEEIVEAREKLEALGLIKTYLKESSEYNSYVYELYSPLKVYDFFNDPILSTILYDTVGPTEYKRVMEYFKIPKINLTGYKNISAKFNDVFTVTNIASVDKVDDIKRRRKLGVSFEPTIDLNNILNNISNEQLNIRSVTKEVKDILYKLALVYDYKDDDMEKIILNSIDDSHKIDIPLLRSNARKFYRFENSNDNLGLIYKNQPEYLKTKLTSLSKKDKMIYVFENQSPSEFLYNKTGVEPTKQEIDIIEYLLVDVGLTQGVINVLLDYVLRTSDNKLVRSYIENKASEWKRCNITTVPDAMEKAKEEQKGRKKSTTKSTPIKPDWLDKTIESREATEEEERAFLEELKNME